MMNEAQALDRLKRLVEPTTDPEMSDPELIDCLDTCKRATIWTTGTAVSINDKMVPAAFNGRLYRCTTAGTTGSTWAVTYATQRNQFIYDGSVVWQDVGPAHGEIFDVRGAAGEAWRRKAAKVAERTNIKDRSVSIDDAALMERCLTMAAQFPALVVK